ncbi:IclR family transcriptional regulator [Cryobacterium sp. Y50]|uniref:IclR family transcriptional regulator n=1 Tax=Cryobacterium sp. Y50 TaxID=2048286 RepID=UPI000CE4F3AB|nr:IclR family transcriptional regulator [Cryobacterium sp. Y50]
MPSLANSCSYYRHLRQNLALALESQQHKIGGSMPLKNGTSIQSVARASRILLEVSHSYEGKTASQIASQFELTLSTAYHLLSTLAQEGLLVKTEGKRYQLGPAAVEIANSPVLRPRTPLAHRDALRRLAARTRETTFLTGWHRGNVQILATVEGAHAVRVVGLEVGFTQSVHARASGKLLLAHADETLLEIVLDGYEFVRHTPNTLLDRAALDADLDRVRSEGLGRDCEEYREGVYSVSAPIRVDGRVVAALTVSSPIERFLRTEREIVVALLETASEASN